MVTERTSNGSWRILALLLMLLAPSILGDGKDFLNSYKQGLRALEHQQWKTAAGHLREAVAERSEESGKLLKKGYMRRYLPHYFLGVALAEQGQCEEALEEWSESEGQGVIVRRKIYKELLDYRERCQTHLDQLPPLERKWVSLEKRAMEYETLSSTLQEQLKKARKDLKTARASLDLARLVRIENLLTEVQKEVQGLEQRAASSNRAQAPEASTTHTRTSTSDRTPKKDRRAARVVETPTGTLFEEVAQLISKLEPVEEQPKEIQALHQQLLELYEEAGRNPEDEEQADLSRIYQRLQRVIDPPPAQLEEAVRTFLEGDYTKVLESLADASLLPERAKVHVHLLRAASLFALNRIQDNENTLVRAHEEARAAVLERSDLDLSERLFSPRFREWVATLQTEQED